MLVLNRHPKEKGDPQPSPNPKDTLPVLCEQPSLSAKGPWSLDLGMPRVT